MASFAKILLFTHHAFDPLSEVISAESRSQYVHAALLIDGFVPNVIFEQYAPHARFRQLSNGELPGIHVFSIAGWTAEQDAKLRSLVSQRVADQIPYWIEGLLLFGSG